MANVHGGEMTARVLEEAGVREIFTLHGGHIDPFLEACDRRGFRIVDTRHEQAAAHMADGWARTTGRLGVCVVTAGPGITDAVTGVANAYMDCVPMLVIAGRSPLRDDDTLPLQGFPQLEMMRPITKWARCVVHPERIPEYVAMAIREATTGRPGPVYLELPIDVLFAPRPEDSIAWPESFRPQHAPAAAGAAVDAVLDLLERAERPAILAGGGVWFSGGAEALRVFAETTSVPVFMNAKARGAVPEDGPLGFGGFALLASPALREGAGVPDVVLLLGARLGLFTGGRRSSAVPPDAKVIQVDIEGEEIGRNRTVDLGIVADCAEFLAQLNERAAGRRWPERSAWLDALALRARRRPSSSRRRSKAIARPCTHSAWRTSSRSSSGRMTSSWPTAAKRRAGSPTPCGCGGLVDSSPTATWDAWAWDSRLRPRRSSPTRKRASSWSRGTAPWG